MFNVTNKTPMPRIRGTTRHIARIYDVASPVGLWLLYNEVSGVKVGYFLSREPDNKTDLWLPHCTTICPAPLC